MDAMRYTLSTFDGAFLRFSARVRRAGDFLLLAQEKVTKENAPQSIAPFGHPAQRIRVSGLVRLTAHPCPSSRMSAIPRAHPAGVSARCRRNAMGTRKSRSSALLRAEARPGAKAPHARALDPAGDLRVPVCRGEGRSEMPERSRARCARVRCLYTDVQSTNPGLTSRTAAGGAASGGCSLWLLSLAQARESDPRAGRARKNEGTRVRRDKSWIPAFAEMTSQEKSAAADGQ